MRVYNKFLEEGYYLRWWKVANLVLISKPRGFLKDLSMYKPLWKLDRCKKLLEKLHFTLDSGASTPERCPL